MSGKRGGDWSKWVWIYHKQNGELYDCPSGTEGGFFFLRILGNAYGYLKVLLSTEMKFY
jgi:hypothetical protein